MNSATFRTLCEAIGVEQQMIVDALGVNVRTVQRWWSTHDPVPTALEYLQKLLDTYDRFLDSEMEALDNQPDGTTAVLTIYRNQESYERTFGEHPPMPWKVYEAAIRQLALYAAMDGKAFTVEYVLTEA